ncbi:glycosyltransferase [Aureitalea marina]|uniref:Glycosyltransferase 2-like domain-containing protein n=1 Tax=Aureitalea marina TaxID=930804 RepID=A0A2S7KML3_9FLAO|nr:glycosyltransferase [Aureitalea marina]PQB03874.1 hypothetical protein BST85_02355 [Aureitalea marina]
MADLISIVLPNYNHAEFLDIRLETILNQTYKDYEIIILDDSSTDASLNVLEKYRNHPKLAHFIVNEVNSGSPFKQWKKGIDLAKGDWIWIAESDDYNDVDFLQKAVNAFTSGASLFFSKTVIVDEHGEHLNEAGAIAPGIHYGVDLLNSFFKFGNIYNASSVVFRKEVSNEILERMTNFGICGDWFLWASIAKNGDVFFDDSTNTYYRNHSTNTSGNLFNNKKYYLEVAVILKSIKALVTIDDELVRHYTKRLYASNLSKKEKLFVLIALGKKMGISSWKPINRDLVIKLRRNVKRSIRRCFNSIKSYYPKNPDYIILVYTSGKVGGSTITRTLKHYMPDCSVFHIHYFTEPWLKKMSQRSEDLGIRDVWGARAKEVKDYLSNNPKTKVKFIALYRDPVAQQISGEFQTSKLSGNLTDYSIDKILESISGKDFFYLEKWFDSEFKSYTGIDICNMTFDRSQDFFIHQDDDFDLMLVSFEKLFGCYREALFQFLEVDCPDLLSDNLTAQKNTALLYEKVKSQFKLPREIVDGIYSSNLMCTLYTEKEIDEFKSKWTK